MKKIKFLRDWRYSCTGDVIEEGEGVAEILIQRGIAEEVDDDTPTTAEMGTDSHDVDQNPLPPVRNRRLRGPRE